MSQNGKGDTRRPESKPGAYVTGWEEIDWSKGRKPAPPKLPTAGEVLLKDYTTPATWVIPPLSEITCPGSYAEIWGSVSRAKEESK